MTLDPRQLKTEPSLLEEIEKALQNISVTCLPNGMLQEKYNPSHEEGIWLAGRNAPSRGEAFRVRISLPRLKRAANWRMQTIELVPETSFSWDE